MTETPEEKAARVQAKLDRTGPDGIANVKRVLAEKQARREAMAKARADRAAKREKAAAEAEGAKPKPPRSRKRDK